MHMYIHVYCRLYYNSLLLGYSALMKRKWNKSVRLKEKEQRKKINVRLLIKSIVNELNYFLKCCSVLVFYVIDIFDWPS